METIVARGRGFANAVVAALTLVSSLYAPAQAVPRAAAQGAQAAATAALAPVSNARWSQLADTVFQHYMYQNGQQLTGTVTAIAEDGDGFLWVGTQGGLLRWDGYRFRQYKTNPADRSSLPDNFIQALLCDKSGRLWVGTSTGGLARYDNTVDSFVRYPSGAQGIGGVSINTIVDDRDGGVWVGSADGVGHLLRDGKIAHIRHIDGDPYSLPDDGVLGLMLDRDKRLWIGTRKGLMRLEADGLLAPIKLPIPNDKIPIVESFMQDESGQVWVGTAVYGAYIVDAMDRIRPLHDGAAQDPADPEDVYSIVWAGSGQVWLGTFGQGLVVVDTATMQTRRLRRDRSLQSSLADDTVWALYRDRAGQIWTGTARGLSRHDPGQQAIVSIFGDTSRKHGVRDIDVISVVPTTDGKIWLALGNNGIDVLDPAGAVVDSVRPDAAHKPGTLPRERILSMAAAGGDMFVGTARGLYRVRMDNLRVNRVELPGHSVNASTDALLYDGKLLWMGSWEDGVWGLAPQSDGQAKVVVRVKARQLSDARVAEILPDGKGSLWVGTGNGLNRIDLRSMAVEKIMADPTSPGALPAGYVTSLLLDRRGRMWLGTIGGGVCLLEHQAAPDKRHFKCLSEREGLPNENVNKMLEAQDGNIWLSTDNGLAVINPNSFTVHALRAADGLSIASYWASAGAVTSQGEVLFGGMGGLTVVRPPLLRDWGYRPPVVVTDARVGGKSVPPMRFNRGGDGQPLTLRADANSLTVEFSSLDFSAPQSNLYAYRLEGFDNGWVENDASRRLATYTNLPPGDYTLHVRGSNRDGLWNEKDLTLPVRVLPAWYQRWWFRLLEVFAALFVVQGIVSARTAFLRKQREELESMVSERTLRLQEASRALEEASLTDPLTGLRNRRFLTQNLDKEITLCLRRYDDAANAGTSPSDADLNFFLVDLDYFKQVNDIYGHAAGDSVLVQMRERLCAVFRESDYLIRWGGEEFLIVARSTDRVSAHELAERMRAVVAEHPFKLDDGTALTRTCSVGFASFPFIPVQPRAVLWQEVVDVADVALYIAKRAGRNGWVGLSTPCRERPSDLMHKLKYSLSEALRQGELELCSHRAHEQVMAAISSAPPAVSSIN